VGPRDCLSGAEEKDSQLLPGLESPIIEPVAQLSTTDKLSLDTVAKKNSCSLRISNLVPQLLFYWFIDCAEP